MKSILTLALLLPALAASAQTPLPLTNGGTTLSVGTGSILYVSGAVLNKTGGTLTNAGTLHLRGDLTNQGTLTSAGTLLFGGTANQTFTPGTTATVATLVQNNTGATGQNILALPADLSVSTTLTLTSGLVRTAAAATLTLGATATLTGEASGRYVQGNLRTSRPVAGSTPVVFPNSISLDPKGQNLGTVTVTRTAGLKTANLSYGQSVSGTNKGIDRVWTVAATGTPPSAATPVSATFSWLTDDDNGFNPAIGAELWRAATAAGPWARMGAASSAATRTFAADVTQFGALTVSNVSAPLPVEQARFAAAQGLAVDAWPRPFGAAGCMVALRPAAPGPATLVVTDALGRPVLSRDLNLPAGSTALSLPELGALATGVYVLRVQQGTAQAVVKLVRE